MNYFFYYDKYLNYFHHSLKYYPDKQFILETYNINIKNKSSYIIFDEDLMRKMYES